VIGAIAGALFASSIVTLGALRLHKRRAAPAVRELHVEHGTELNTVRAEPVVISAVVVGEESGGGSTVDAGAGGSTVNSPQLVQPLPAYLTSPGGASTANAESPMQNAKKLGHASRKQLLQQHV